ncbi:MAG: serine/threonine-protein kinase [Azovibrio sp.]|nr:serine/threonine-protein kinase [Azovibrio sp.]
MQSFQQRYEILRELGRGASGSVYLAQDLFADQQVALKIAHPQIFAGDDPEQKAIRKAWLNEVRLAGRLRHPYIVEVFDAGMGDATAYLAMEYLPGGTLEPYTRPGQLKPVREVLEIAYKCASALDYACRAGIVHRDIKPANLQYAGPGEVKIGDFGAAYWGRSDSTQVMDIGSLSYMAPELFRHWVTPQADIYALGVVLFQLLTGQLPFVADSPAALMYKILNGERPRLSDLRPDLPSGLDALVEEMLAVSLERRFAAWPLVLAALTALMPDTAGNAGEPPAAAELFERLRRLPLLQELADPQLWELLRFAHWRRAPAGTVLIQEGAAARSCYLLLEGETRVTQRGRLINLLTAGTLFGELAFAEAVPSPRAATVTAMTPVLYGKWAYSRLNRASPELRSGMLKIFFRLAAERLKQADEQYQLLYRRLQAAPG